IESDTVVLSCSPAVDIDHREIHLRRGIAAAGSLLKPMAGLADVCSLSGDERGNQNQVGFSINPGPLGGGPERRDVTGSLDQGPTIFGRVETGVQGSSVLPDCISFGIACGSTSVSRGGQLTGAVAAASWEYRSERLGVGVARCKAQSENRTQ